VGIRIFFLGRTTDSLLGRTTDSLLGGTNDLLLGGTNDLLLGGTNDLLLGGTNDLLLGGTNDLLLGGTTGCSIMNFLDGPISWPFNSLANSLELRFSVLILYTAPDSLREPALLTPPQKKRT